MSTKKINNNYANLILANESNNFCVDCGTPNPTHVSINNGVTMCQDCSDVHLSLGIGISYIRLLNGKWDDYLYKFFLYGGNENFIKTFQLFSKDKAEEKVEGIKTINIGHKYKSNIARFYRKFLLCKVEGIEMNESFDDFVESKKGVEFYTEDYPKFFNYQVNDKTLGFISKGLAEVSRKMYNGIGTIGKKIGKATRKAKATKASIINKVKGFFWKK